MKHKAITVTACDSHSEHRFPAPASWRKYVVNHCLEFACDCAFNFEYFLVCPSYYYSIIYTVSLLLLLWLCVSDHEFSQHHASFHVHVYFHVISGIKVWLIDWLIDLLTDWLTDWLTGWLAGWLAGWLTDWLTDWVTDWLIDWLTDWLIGWVLLTAWLADWRHLPCLTRRVQQRRYKQERKRQRRDQGASNPPYAKQNNYAPLPFRNHAFNEHEESGYGMARRPRGDRESRPFSKPTNQRQRARQVPTAPSEVCRLYQNALKKKRQNTSNISTKTPFWATTGLLIH